MLTVHEQVSVAGDVVTVTKPVPPAPEKLPAGALSVSVQLEGCVEVGAVWVIVIGLSPATIVPIRMPVVQIPIE